MNVLIAHAPNEEHWAEKIAEHLRKEGFEILHMGTVMVGDSFLAQASAYLESQCPVILCATIKAMGTEWAPKIVRNAQIRGCSVHPVQMEREAYIGGLLFDYKPIEYWQDESKALNALSEALQAHFPNNDNIAFDEQLKEFELQKKRVERKLNPKGNF